MFSAVLDDAMREQREGETDDDLLFTRPYDDGYRTYMVNGESPSRKNGGWLWFAERRAGAPFVTIHDLCHTADSIMIHAGANVKTVQCQLGHASAAMTLDVYADLFDDDLDALSESIGRVAVARKCGQNVGRQCRGSGIDSLEWRYSAICENFGHRPQSGSISSGWRPYRAAMRATISSRMSSCRSARSRASDCSGMR